MKYLVTEIQTFENGAVSNPTYAYDNENSALSKFYSVLSAAAVSKLPTHACMLFTSEGIALKSECFIHPVEEEPSAE